MAPAWGSGGSAAAEAIQVRGLRKDYQGVPAVRGIDFAVHRGEVFALLGPNGAGKSTTLEILEGFRERSGGEALVLGQDPAGRPRELRERVGVVLQETVADPYLTVREVVARSAGYYPNPRPVDEIVEAVGLGPQSQQKVRRLSGGQQRRLDVALGMVGRPELIFLDEPTTGFDPSARREAWELVRTLRADGTTVLLTTHYLDEAAALADRVAVLAAGRLVAIGTPDTLGGRDHDEAVVRFRLPAGVDAGQLPALDGAVLVAGDVVTVRTGSEVRTLHAITSWALERSVELTGLSCERPTLEDVYLRLISAAIADAGDDAGDDVADRTGDGGPAAPVPAPTAGTGATR